MILIDSLAVGGAQRLIEVQIRAMARGRRVRVLNLSGPSPLSEKLRAAGIEVVDGDVSRLTDLPALQRVLGILRGWAPAVVHAHLIHSTLIGGYFAARSRTPLIVTLHNESPDRGGLLAQTKNRLEEWVLLHRTDTVVACGPRVAEARRRRVGDTRLLIVPNQIETPPALQPAERESLRATLGLAPDDVGLLAVGRIERQKGYDILLEAFHRVALGQEKLFLLVAGDGTERQNLEAITDKLGVASRVRFLGTREDVAQLLGAADAFVLPSRWEGLPLVLLEALAAGLAVVASGVGDIPTVVGKAGLLVQPEDPAALAEALYRLAIDPELRANLGAAARLAAKPYTDPEELASQLDAIYIDAVCRAGSCQASR